MPWKECSVMDGRMRFVARLLDGEAMSEVSRVRHFAQDPGYKIFERYKEHGLKALTDSAADPPIISIIGAAASCGRSERQDPDARTALGARPGRMSPCPGK